MEHETLGKRKLVKIIAKATGYTKKDVNKGMDWIVNLFKDKLLKGDKITIENFGTFTVSIRKERLWRNFRIGEMVKSPATKKIHFKTAVNFKKKLNGR